jgi:hypothetical protein
MSFDRMTLSALALLTAVVAVGCTDGGPLTDAAQILHKVNAAVAAERARAGHAQLARRQSQRPERPARHLLAHETHNRH